MKYVDYLKNSCKLVYSDVSENMLYWKRILLHTSDIILVS